MPSVFWASKATSTRALAAFSFGGMTRSVVFATAVNLAGPTREKGLPATGWIRQ